MIVVVLLVGGWLGWLVRSARIQREAVAAITRKGGMAQYDWEFIWERRDDDVPNPPPWASRRLTDTIGVDCFGHVTDVWLDPEDADAVLVEVGRLTQLKRLKILDPDVPVATSGWLA